MGLNKDSQLFGDARRHRSKPYGGCEKVYRRLWRILRQLSPWSVQSSSASSWWIIHDLLCIDNIYVRTKHPVPEKSFKNCLQYKYQTNRTILNRTVTISTFINRQFGAPHKWHFYLKKAEMKELWCRINGWKFWNVDYLSLKILIYEGKISASMLCYLKRLCSSGMHFYAEW